MIIKTVYWFLLHGIEAILKNTLFSPVFIFAVLFILFLEHFYPVNPKQRGFSAGFIQDMVWVVLAISFTTIVLAAYTNLLRSFYSTRLSFFTVKAAVSLPNVLRLVLGVLLGDFLAWFQHWVKHKVPWFWRIHAVHHSQREINLFTDFRFHYLEYIISRPIVLIPLMLFSVETPDIMALGIFMMWFPRLYHANIKSNFGFLRYIFVSPQSHRVHHSIEERHQDMNFGVIFSFWDRLFKTHYEFCDEYPGTGIKDDSFPLGKEKGFLSLVTAPLEQLVYPFYAIGQNTARKN